MNISKIALWLSVLVAILVLLASGAGLVSASIYARETMSWKLQTYGQDIANLVAVVALLLAVYFVNRGSVTAFLIWVGILLALIYAYVIYAFALHFNSLFLLYVAILGLSVYALVIGILNTNMEYLQSYTPARITARSVSVFLLLIAVLFAVQWLSEDIPALMGGKIPQSVVENGMLTNPVHVLDLGMILPAMVIASIALWRRKLLGYLFALPLLVFCTLTGIGILAAFLVMSSRGVATSVGVEVFFAAIIVVSLVLSVFYARTVKEQKGVSFV